MNWNRVVTIMLYSWYHLRHSLETWVDLLWFPVVEIAVFGIFISFVEGQGGEYGSIILMGLIFWEVVRVTQYSITVSVMWDVWSRSFSSLFISPINMREVIAGQALAGFIKALFVFLLLSFMSYLMFNFSIFQLGLSLIAYVLLVALFGLSAGIFIFGLILRFGTDIQSLSWSLVFLFQPLSAVIYPVEALPEPMQVVSYLTPLTYVMEATRSHLATGKTDWSLLGMSLLVNLIYLAITVLFLSRMHKWAKSTGAFARMEM